jgi:uncharacterized protein
MPTIVKKQVLKQSLKFKKMKSKLKYTMIAAVVLNNTDVLAQMVLQKNIPINFSQVNITDKFWKPKMNVVATTTLQTCILQTEVKTPRIRNFEKVARKQAEKHEGMYYDDSDVYKALEAIAYSLKNNPNASLENKADEWIDKIAATQLPDGYLNTYYTLTDIGKRWTDIEKHEDYNAGHLIEAGVAYFEATGKRKLLDVSIRFANHIDSTFRLANRTWFSGHQEIELALVKLYKTTKDKRYLDLADWYLQQRGISNNAYDYKSSWITPDYWQSGTPVKNQKEITGHAVRAMYLYTGAADVAIQTGDNGYMNAMQNVWEDVVHRNMYITGGIGASGSNEGFTNDYDLPNEHAYCETCASVGMIFWNQRMNALTGDAKYIDVLERSLYNGALDGLSLSGDRFFYGNPLASNGNYTRSEWFGTACCPSNIARMVSALGDYIYARSDTGIWVNLFIGSSTTISLEGVDVPIQLDTNYPLDGKINLTLNPTHSAKFKTYLRIPEWASKSSIAGGLYMYQQEKQTKIDILLNGKTVKYQVINGYAVLEQTWEKGDKITMNLPMDVKKIVARPELKQNNDRVAIQRGPLVYCVEGVDNNGNAWDFVLPNNVKFTETAQTVVSESIIALKTNAIILEPTVDGQFVKKAIKPITAIPYYVWANRGKSQMQVWMPTKFNNLRVGY